MAILSIHDRKERCLTLDLRDLLRLLAPRSLEATWVVSTVKSSEPGHEWFEATGHSGEQLEELADHNAQLPGSELAMLADSATQVIWGEFVGWHPKESEKAWVTIRAIDSSYYEVDTDDEIVLSKIRSSYEDVRNG